MKLKHVLSVLLAAVLFAGFAVQSAFAAWEPPTAIEITQSGSWQQMEFRWNVPGDAAAFFAGVDNGTIAYEWNVNRVSDNFNLTMLVPSELRQEGVLVVNVRAGGILQVSLIVNGQASAPIQAQLFEDFALQYLLTQANRLAQNPSRRYCADYITRLREAITAAQALYVMDVEEITQELLNARIEQLLSLVEAPELALTSSGLLNRFIPGWWRIVDVVTAPFLWLQDRAEVLFAMIGQIFTAMFSL